MNPPFPSQPLGAPPTFPGLAGVSGVPNDAAATPIGKLFCASVTGALRNLPPRLATIMPMLLMVPPNAHIYEEHSGSNGRKFHRLKFRAPHPVTGKSRVVSQYVGVLTDEQLKWATAILQERADDHARRNPRHEPVPFDAERVAMLQRMMKMAHVAARAMALRAGYSFRGYRLMRRRAR